jgi:dihydropyrimidinase
MRTEITTDAPILDLLIEGGTIVTATAVSAADLAIKDGVVVGIGAPGSYAGRARRVIDASRTFVLPGGVDPHCHYGTVRAGNESENESYSAAAAYGGTTTLLDFVWHDNTTTLHAAIDQKRQRADGTMSVDYGLHAILTGDVPFGVIEELGDVIRGGIPTIKTFMTYDGLMVDDGHRLGVMQAVATHGGMSVVHAEDDAIARWLTKRYVSDGRVHGGYIVETHGPLVEEAAVRRALLLAEHTGSPLYVLHIAAGSAVSALADARSRGAPAYGETLTTYLAFTADKLWQEGDGLLWNNFPPLKYESDRQTLWDALVDDRLQTVGSDQWASMRAEREEMGSTIEALQCGQASVELRLPVVYELGVRSGRLTLNRFVDVVATSPAKLMGLYPRKGDLLVGSDADVVVLDPNASWIVSADALHMRADWNCWSGWELHSKVIATVLRGEILVERGKWVGPSGAGLYLDRKLAPAVTAWSPRGHSRALNDRSLANTGSAAYTSGSP